MTYTQTVIDDFNDNSLSATVWAITDSADIAETSAQLQIHATTPYPGIKGQSKIYDVTTAILAMKVLAPIGAATASTEFGFGITDDAGSAVWINSTPTNNWYEFASGGSATISSAVGEGSGVGTDWTAGNWMGMGNLGADNILHFYRSSDGQTWTEIGHVTVGGTFHKTTAALDIYAGCYSGTTTYKAVVDDASYWSQSVAADPQGGFFDIL